MKKTLILLTITLVFLMGCAQQQPAFYPHTPPPIPYPDQLEPIGPTYPPQPVFVPEPEEKEFPSEQIEKKSEFKTYSPPDFAIHPEIQCWYNETYGEINYKITNSLKNNTLHIARTSYIQPRGQAHISMILNGRLVEPEDYCDKIILEPNEQGLCSIKFDPTQQKTGIFRIYHNYDYLQEYSGEKPRDVLRIRLLNEGKKTRANIKFDCESV